MKKTSNLKFRIYFIIILSFLFSCSEDDDQLTSVVTEEAVYVSSETVRLVGRVLSISNDNLSNHGFLISTDIDLSSPITVDLGQRNELGRFVGETNELESNQKYFFAAFSDINDQRVVGNVLELNTLNSSITNFQPITANPGDPLVIFGSNFLKDSRVLIGDFEAEVLKIDFESRIEIEIPEIVADNFSVPVKVISGSDTLQFEDNFEYIIGKWTEEIDFVNNSLIQEGITLSHETNLIFGLGVLSGSIQNPDIWSLDLIDLEWTQLNFKLGIRSPFQTNDYFGNGSVSFGLGGRFYTNEFRKFDGQFNNLESTPFSLYKGIALENDEKIFVLGGEQEDASTNSSIYEYDKNLDQWSLAGSTIFPITSPTPHFIFNNNIYVLNQENNELWKLDLGTFQWQFFINAPSEDLDTGGLAFVIDGHVFMGLFELDNRIWELDIATKTWKEKMDYTGSRGDRIAGYIVNQDKLWLIQSPFNNLPDEETSMKVWSFDPFDL